ncbi:hypothetical protein GOV11_01520 [Candidatus Woesearchaeota archaeon]|nr:hypothetical protein [Candidatus Woesearchaeota archaeon]
MQCPKCKTEMTKKNTHVAGNIDFQRWQCESCWQEHNTALGVSGGMPDWSE